MAIRLIQIAIHRRLPLGLLALMLSASTAFAEAYSVRDLQSWLHQLDYDPGPVDGQWGGKTRRALEAFYRTLGKEFDGELDRNEVQDLSTALKQAGLDGPTVSESRTYPEPNSGQLPSLVDKSELTHIFLRDYSDDATIVHGINIFDIEEDGANEVFLCGTTYRDFPSHPVTVLKVTNDSTVDATERYFENGVPNSNDCTEIIFTDLNNDNQADVVFTDAGRDAPPWTGTSIEVALNNGNGFTRITEQFETKTWGIRAYAVAAGDLDGDHLGEIILTSGNDAEKSRILEFNESGIKVTANRYVSSGQWWDPAGATNMKVLDLDGDGENDIYIGGNWAGPSNVVLWSALRGTRFAKLPDTPLGHADEGYGVLETIQGADVTATAISDFDLDGDLDIINAYEHLLGTKNGSGYDMRGGNSSLQILRQDSPRKFETILPSFPTLLGHKYFLPSIVYDINGDSYPDVILNYWQKHVNWLTGNNYGSIILQNLGGMDFKRIEAGEFIGYDQNLRGMIFPISRTGDGTTVLVLQTRSGRAGQTARTFISYTGVLSF